MKDIIFSILILSATASSFAQKFELGINGGLAHYNIHDSPQGFDYLNFTGFQSSVIAPSISLKGMYIYKHYRFGIDAGYRVLTYKYIREPEAGWIFLATTTNKTTIREIPMNIFVNRTVTFNRLEVYGGFSAGYVLVDAKTEVLSPAGWPGSGRHSDGRLTGGIQAGATFFVTKRLGINAEVQGVYNNFPAGPLDHNTISVPVSIGIRYKL
jgi:hypothetical protein